MALPTLLVTFLNSLSLGLLIGSLFFFVLALRRARSTPDEDILLPGEDVEPAEPETDEDDDAESSSDGVAFGKSRCARCFPLLALLLLAASAWNLAKVPYYFFIEPMTNVTYNSTYCHSNQSDPMCYGPVSEVQLLAWSGYRGASIVGNPVVFIAPHVTLGCLVNVALILLMLTPSSKYRRMHLWIVFVASVLLAIHVLPMAGGFPNNVSGCPVNQVLVAVIVVAGVVGGVGMLKNDRWVSIAVVVVAVAVNQGPLGEVFLLLCPRESLPPLMRSDEPLPASGHGLYAEWEQIPNMKSAFKAVSVIAMLIMMVYPIIVLNAGSTDVVPVVAKKAKTFRVSALSWFFLFMCISLQNYNGPEYWFPFTGEQSELAVLNWAYPKNHAKCQEYLGANVSFDWCYTTGVLTYSFPDSEDRLLPGSPGPFPLTNIMAKAVSIGADMTTKFMTVNMIGAAQQFKVRRDTYDSPAWQYYAFKGFWVAFIVYWVVWIYVFNLAIATAEAFPTFCALYVTWLWGSDRDESCKPSTLTIALTVAFYLFFPHILKPTSLTSSWAFTFVDVVSSNLSHLGWWPNNIGLIQALYDIGTQTLEGNYGLGLQMYHDAGWVAIAAGFYVVVQGFYRAGGVRIRAGGLPPIVLGVGLLVVALPLVACVALANFFLAYVPFVAFIIYESFVGNSLLAVPWCRSE
eukprot:TRINITY_DN38416_c0_g1_i1.p1 TRINITY_DN38416_c0_g1~~TRINITY_DN38416_c0_g1_i1.p1  ORF type:complete len:685 (-),score=94.97 TRINITY_DN38416_c0_g1_i1:25-2079(-)